jgi:hypothetical protein
MDISPSSKINFRKFSAFSDKRTEYTTLSNLMYKQDKNLKVGIILATIILVCSISVSLVFPIFESQPRVLTFNYQSKSGNSKDELEIENAFSINIIMLYIFLIVLALINSFLTFLLISEKDSLLVKLIYSEFKWLLLLTQCLISSAFIIGISVPQSGSTYPFIYSATISSIIVILVCFFYKWIKLKKNLSIGAFTTLSAYTSIIFSFMIYFTFFNLSEILIYILKGNDNIDIDLIKEICSITSHSILMFINFVLIAYFKDIIFSLTFSYFLLGYLCSKAEISKKEFVSVIVILVFNVVAILVTWFKYGKKSFGFEDDRTVDEILAARSEQKKSSWFSGNV